LPLDLVFEMPRTPAWFAKDGDLIPLFKAACARHFHFLIPIVTAIHFDAGRFLA
jgi:hypothetical protein